MWSNLYWYYELRGNAAYSHYLPAHTICEAFEDTGVLEKKQSQVYCNKEECCVKGNSALAMIGQPFYIRRNRSLIHR